MGNTTLAYSAVSRRSVSSTTRYGTRSSAAPAPCQVARSARWRTSVRRVALAEARRDGAERALPGCRRELLRAAHQGLQEPALPLEGAVAHPPRVAHPVLVHGIVLARLEAVDGALAVVDLHVAAVGACPAH